MPIDPSQVKWDAPPQKLGTPESFKEAYGPAAERASKLIGVPAGVILGQWGLETGWGKSIIPGTNNLGNIKDFAGGGVEATDNMTGSRDKYRAYETPDQFVDDYANLIQRRYPNAVGAKDASAFASALKSGGYAEDPAYVAKVAKASSMADRNPLLAKIGRAVSAVIPSAQAAPRQKIDPSQVQWDEPAKAPTSFTGSIDPKGVRWDDDVKPASASAIASGIRAASMFSPFGPIMDVLTDGKPEEVALGALRGAASIGNTIINSGTKAGADLWSGVDDPLGLIDPRLRRPPAGITNLVTGQKPLSAAERSNADRQASLAAFDSSAPSSAGYKLGKIGAEVAGTAGVGGVLAAPVRAFGAAAQASPAVGNLLSRFANALASGGTTIGPGGSVLANTAVRMGGGAASGYAGAGLIDPEAARTGALVGALVPPVIGVASRAGGAFVGGVRGLVDMASERGQQRIADAVLRASATDPVAAASRVAQARPVVPGSAPTIGQVAEDPGLAQLERTLINNPQTAGGLQQRYSAQRAARAAAIDDVAATTPASGTYYDDIVEGRRIFANEDYARARAQGIDPEMAASMQAEVASLLERPSIRTAINDARRLAAETGETIGDLGSVRGLDWVKKALDNQISKATNGPTSSIGAEDLRALMQTRNDLNATLEQLAPAYREANRNYAAMSRQVNSMDVARDLDRVYTPVAANFGASAKEQANAYLKALARAQESVKRSTGMDQDLAQTLATNDVFALENVARDLARKQYVESAGAAVGSPTAQNLLSQYFINQVAQGAGLSGSAAAKSIPLLTLLRPLQFAGRLAEPKVNNRLLEFALNPEQATQVLKGMPQAEKNSLLKLFNQAPRAVPVLTSD
ncbi:glucosaminidase domain-containing protein [Variovorax sp.]|uniref:glycoside hydrolase family 73 protein n=1 Tax=Variovorax sp. TaxID=1871043 RepID=UPI0025D39004|nr:glucosaminidase domain-containing protein [Variovorax sp.]